MTTGMVTFQKVLTLSQWLTMSINFLRDDEENSPEEKEDTNDCIAQENVSL